LPGEAETRLPTDGLVVGKSLMESGANDLVVRDAGIVIDVEERTGQTGKTIGLANGIGVVLSAQGERELEAPPNGPFILRIKTEAV